MREIKFRGRKNFWPDGGWLIGSLLVTTGEGSTRGYTHQIYDSVIGKDIGWIYVGVETVGQYIGRQDKNGNEIYEGDIVGNDICESIHPIEFHEGAFLWDGDLLDHYSGEFEIIGNIHENPELLESP